jgi:hypothetical protein
MRPKHLLTVVLFLFSFSVLAGPAVAWEVRKTPDGSCVVKTVGEKPVIGTRVSGPFANQKEARKERDRLKLTPKCR